MILDETSTKLTFIERFYAFLFALLFIAQILSPSVGERTVYLELIVAIFNPYFWTWVEKPKLKPSYLMIVFTFIIIIVTGHLMTAIKLCVNLFYVMYLSYIWSRKLWIFMDYMMLISVVFAVIQLIMLGIDPELSRFFGPNAISTAIWGSYATATNTNFYNIFEFGLPRVSGLSREAGFLASLIVVWVWHRSLIKDENRGSRWRNRIVCGIGYICSFSKMSLAIIAIFLCDKAKNYINKIPFLYIVMFFIVLMTWLWTNYVDYLIEPSNITFLSRFGAYDSLCGLDVTQIMFGEHDLDKVSSITAINEFYGENAFAGMGGWLIDNGLIVMLCFIAMLYILGISSTGVLLLMFATINVQPDTNQNFVALAWYIIFTYYCRYNYSSYENKRLSKI